MLHADDLIRLYSLAFQNSELMHGEIFNIGGGVTNSLSLLELFDLLSELLDIPPLLFTRTPRRASDQDCFIADISKVRSILGWSPSVTSRDGVIRMLDWSSDNVP